MRSKFFNSIFCCLLMNSVAKAQYEGSSCRLSHNGVAGICKSVRSCPEAVVLYRQGINPTICSYTSSSPIVCCLENSWQNSFTPVNTETWRGMSAKKCEEYKSKVTVKTKAAGLTAVLKPISISSETCKFSTGLIVGGEKASRGEFPHAVALGDQNGIFFCGGSLISERFVLTAAHCIGRRFNVFARLGHQNIRALEERGVIDIPVSQFIKHEKYKGSSKQNDIALAKLAYDATFSDTIRPACLWQNSQLNTDKLVAIGWGRTSNDDLEGSNDLLKVTIDVFNTNQCVDKFSEDPTIVINENQICAGTIQDRRDTCQGDSGGSIQVVDAKNKCIYNIVGITSFGGVCGADNTLSVYTRVSNYIPWIEEKVWG